MHKTSPAEWLLARITAPDRATVILGDLTEMAATRSRLWFVAAYLRTLAALGWRSPVAVVAAVVSSKYLRSILARLFSPRVLNLNDWLLAERHSHLGYFSWTVSWAALLFLWIAFPYVAIRFGLRNRLTYLAGTLLLLAMPMYTFRPQVYHLTGLACAVIVVAALASAAWRRQMIFLIGNCAAAYCVFYFCIVHAPGILRHDRVPLSVFGMRIDDPVAIAITVMIGPPLYRWLLQTRPPGAANA
jgi:hypothetical protein